MNEAELSFEPPKVIWCGFCGAQCDNEAAFLTHSHDIHAGYSMARPQKTPEYEAWQAQEHAMWAEYQNAQIESAKWKRKRKRLYRQWEQHMARRPSS